VCGRGGADNIFVIVVGSRGYFEIITWPSFCQKKLRSTCSANIVTATQYLTGNVTREWWPAILENTWWYSYSMSHGLAPGRELTKKRPMIDSSVQASVKLKVLARSWWPAAVSGMACPHLAVWLFMFCRQVSRSRLVVTSVHQNLLLLRMKMKEKYFDAIDRYNTEL
jgi:hypothetical protein